MKKKALNYYIEKTSKNSKCHEVFMPTKYIHTLDIFVAVYNSEQNKDAGRI